MIRDLSPNNFSGRRALVMGLGLQGGGLHLTQWLLRQGAIVRVTDLKTRAQLSASLRQLPRSGRLSYTLGRHQDSDFRWAEIVVQNPGVPRESPYLKIAQKSGARIENEATIFFKIVGRERIVGITGTRGKSTTAALTAAILRKIYPRTILAGNIATTPMFSVVERALRSRAPIVLELSSWHLENLGEQKISPRVAVVTNVLFDHMNRYRTFGSYAAAKRQIVAHQQPGDIAILNADNPVTRTFSRGVTSSVVWFGKSAQSAVTISRGWICLQSGKTRTRVAQLRACRIGGDHNAQHMLAAVAVGKIFGVPMAAMRQAVQHFPGLPYRMQTVAKSRSVTYVNDTTATTPDATMAALHTLASMKNIILIAGGSDKGIPQQKFDELGEFIRRYCKAVVLFAGEGSKKIQKALTPYSRLLTPNIITMADAVAAAQVLAQSGDLILLSPACASFGLFLHEFDRGEQFNQCVNQIVSRQDRENVKLKNQNGK